MVDVLSPPPRSVTLQFPVLIAGPGEYEGPADEKEGYFYPGCCIDRFLHIQHAQSHTCGSIRRYLLRTGSWRALSAPFLECVCLHVVGSVSSGIWMGVAAAGGGGGPQVRQEVVVVVLLRWL